MKTDLATETDLPSSNFDHSISDRSENLQFYRQLAGSDSFEAITGKTIGVTASVAHSPSGCKEGDNFPVMSFYTPTNDGTSHSSPSLLSSSSPKDMIAVTRHLPKSDLTTPAPSAEPAPAPAPLLSSTRCSSNSLKSTGPRFEAEGPTRVSPDGGRGGKGSAGKKSPTSVSRLCFPFVTTSPKRKDKVKDRRLVLATAEAVSNPGSTNSPGSAAISVPPPLVKSLPPSASSPSRYSCAPTRFCPFGVKSQRTPPLHMQKHQRHLYANRGYSHEALEYVKSFWCMRQEGIKSDGGKAYMEESKIARTVHPGAAHQTQKRSSVDESSPTGSRPITTTATSSSTATTTTASLNGTAVPSIHPRRGDISALRDPQCAEADRIFDALGIWTISKMVWMVDVGVGIRKLERKRNKEEVRRRNSHLRVKMLWHGEGKDGDEGGSLDASMRSTSLSSLSDDSLTLVDDESLSCVGSDDDEDDMLQLVIRGRKITPQAHDQGLDPGCSAGLSATPSISPGSEYKFDRSALYHIPIEASKLKLSGSGSQLEWTTDWTSRWEIVRNRLQDRNPGCGVHLAKSRP